MGLRRVEGWSRRLRTKVSQVPDPSHLPSGAEREGRERRLMEVSPHPAGEGFCPEGYMFIIKGKRGGKTTFFLIL